jgi:hypothetical protein
LPASADALVSIWIDGTDQVGPQTADSGGQLAIVLAGGLTAGQHSAEATYQDQSTLETGSSGVSILTVMAAAPGPGQVPPASPPALPDPATTGAAPDVAASYATTSFISAGATGAPGIDPFTGSPAADPFTGQPLSAIDPVIGDLIRDVYAQPAIDLSGVPQSAQNAILDVYSQPAMEFADERLPGMSISEYIEGGLTATYEAAIGGVSAFVEPFSELVRSFADNVGFAGDVTLHTIAQVASPVFGALQAYEGLQEFDAGVVFGTVTSPTLVGGVVGAGVAAHGVDNFITGIQKILGQDAETATYGLARAAVAAVTDDPTAIEIIPRIVDIGPALLPAATGAFSKWAGAAEEVGILGSEVNQAEGAAARSELEAAAAATAASDAVRIESVPSFPTPEGQIDQVGNAVAAQLNRTGGSAGLNDWTVFTPPPVIEITYGGQALADPSFAVFLGKNLEMAQEDLGFLTRWGPRLETDRAYRSAASRWFEAQGFDLSNIDMSHPLDTIAAGNYLSEGQGTTYYAGNRSVNRWFGGTLQAGLNKAGVGIGDPFMVQLVGFPDLPLVAPPASPPYLPSRYR